MNNELALRILNTAVERAKEEGMGLCWGISEVTDEHTDTTVAAKEITVVELELSRLMKEWPYYSGDFIFPVPPSLSPCDEWASSPGVAFADAKHSALLWDETTPYGQARWAMVNWMREQLS